MTATFNILECHLLGNDVVGHGVTRVALRGANGVIYNADHSHTPLHIVSVHELVIEVGIVALEGLRILRETHYAGMSTMSA